VYVCTVFKTCIFRKWRTQTLGWMHNWNLFTKYIFWFVEPFSACFASKFLKKLIWQKKNSPKIKKGIQKRRISRWFQIRWKSNKKCTKKVIGKTSLTNMSEREKSAYFCHVFANNFFYVELLKKIFQRIWNQRKILRFLIPILNFWITFFCCYY
jgi:hypothetical protein